MAPESGGPVWVPVHSAGEVLENTFRWPDFWGSHNGLAPGFDTRRVYRVYVGGVPPKGKVKILPAFFTKFCPKIAFLFVLGSKIFGRPARHCLVGEVPPLPAPGGSDPPPPRLPLY